MTMFYTSEHLQQEIDSLEARLVELKIQRAEAKVRDFYFHLLKRDDAVDDDEWMKFTEAEWTISFMGKSVTLPNSPVMCEGMEELFRDYMDEFEIPYKEEAR